ncbi:TlyA family rRNA (cytidine-2'-O)-methyltransferase [Boudabousia liubingyangii]|uniref:TlyA family RNA methyltransferase n=1 Tax=Boudabousia liubingyangii TaxID=1921764 RepID=UPI00093D4F38|nr:TlyA family RNA methyltransferase [Boudabousia liubingyangii]OKL47574.1 TlyA family rRNA (cytidine-2'-O)-methyltransferase [Boudabousia liubingyangii]
MGKLRRLDSEMVRRQLARSRTQAAQLIAAGQVKVSGETVLKAARQIDPAEPIVLDEAAADQYVSRGAFKLAGALDYLGDKAPKINGALCLDAGASTGGFTDVLLRRGAQKVTSVDVGYGQLAWSLQSDPRVEVMDRTNVRNLQPEQLPYRPEILVGDLSFISLTLIIPALARCALPTANYLLMVKPQFEIGKELLGAGGVVRNPDHHEQTVNTVAKCALENGLKVQAVAPSPLPGPAGNVEYFLHLSGPETEGGLSAEEIPQAIATAVAARPQAEKDGHHA